MTAVDLRRCLGLRDRAASEFPTNVVIGHEDGAVSLLVDEIGDVLEVKEEAFEPPPETLNGRVRELILGVYKLQDRLMHVLNTDKALNPAGLENDEKASS